MKAILASFMLMASTLTSADTSILNVFYDGRTEELAVNTVRENNRSGFIRTNKIVLITDRVSICENGCDAKIEGLSSSSFAVNVAGHIIATIKTNDSDNLLSSKAFSVLSGSRKEKLVLNLNILENDSRAEVR